MVPSFINTKRKEVVARTLRLLAASVEASYDPAHLREISLGLQDVTTLIQMCLYENQKQLIQMAKHDISMTEVANG